MESSKYYSLVTLQYVKWNQHPDQVRGCVRMACYTRGDDDGSYGTHEANSTTSSLRTRFLIPVLISVMSRYENTYAAQHAYNYGD